MSVRVMSAVFDRYPAGGGEMLLALALADVARDDGVLMINDNVAELARKTRQTDRGVRGQLRRMEEIGWLHRHANGGGRGRCAVYRIDSDWLHGGELPEPETRNGTTSNPEPGSGFADTETRNVATLNPERGSGLYITIDTKYSNTPQPPKGGDIEFADAGSPKNNPAQTEPQAAKPEPEPKLRRKAKPAKPGMLTLRAWLELCQQREEVPIPAEDPVFGYCASVGIGTDILALHWREFKLRRLQVPKRQADWRQTFRNSVRGNWYRLWFIKPGFDAQLTTQGMQAQALMRADEAQGVAQ